MDPESVPEPMRNVFRGKRSTSRDWEMLLICFGAILAAFLLEMHPDERLRLHGLPRVAVPPLCGSRAIFGVNCPGCGLTRSLVHLTHGHWNASYHSHRLGWVVGAAMLAQIPYRAANLYRRKEHLPNAFRTAFGGTLIVALLLNWLLELIY